MTEPPAGTGAGSGPGWTGRAAIPQRFGLAATALGLLAAGLAAWSFSQSVARDREAHAAFPMASGQLRVVREDGSVLDWRAALIRNLLRAVDSLPGGYLFGLASVMLSPKAQRLGDIAGGTIVIRERTIDPSELGAELVVNANVEAGFRFTGDEIRRVGEVERRLIRRTLRRVEPLSERAARPLIARTVAAISGRIERSEPIPAGLERQFLAALVQASERLL